MLDSCVQAVRRIEDRLQSELDARLVEHLQQLRLEAVAGDRSERVEDLLCAAAIGAQAVRRTIGYRLHDVQIRGALAAAAGSIIEMQTGQGKTVVCGLTALIRSVFDRSIHVATTSDYLAERDYESVRPIFDFLGTSSSVIRLDADPRETLAAYRCQITYGPGYLFGFDYLKDQIRLKENESLTLGRDVLDSIHGRHLADELAQPIHQTIIVDEADSVLIDESTTPLILSGGSDDVVGPRTIEGFRIARQVARQLDLRNHFTVDRAQRIVELTRAGLQRIHEELARYGRLELLQPWPVYIKNALFAEHLLLRDEHYVVDEHQIKLVDQNTGRIFEDRTLRGGLHQAVEAAEGLDINPPNRTLARVTRQRFFQLYERICGMTGTATGSEQELEHFYGSHVVPLQPHQPCKRIELPDRFF